MKGFVKGFLCGITITAVFRWLIDSILAYDLVSIVASSVCMVCSAYYSWRSYKSMH